MKTKIFREHGKFNVGVLTKEMKGSKYWEFIGHYQKNNNNKYNCFIYSFHEFFYSHTLPMKEFNTTKECQEAILKHHNIKKEK